MIDDQLQTRHDRLTSILKGFDSLLVAFSGGVDSALLLAAARDALGDRVLAVTAESPIHPRSETESAKNMARRLGVRLIV
ncbi:MAG: TIGR00268 family protein, partial [Desulfobacterales bacterium]|nr:TIGR00268 family protein [Desulfobacterales bacterium]